MSKYLKKYYKKAECQNVYNAEDSIMMTMDLHEDEGMKEFCGTWIHEIDDIIFILNRENAHMYEALPPDFPVKPYFDCEMEYIGLTPELIKSKIKTFINWLCKEINFVFETNLVSKDFQILNSSRHEKLSYHIIIIKKVYFNNIAEHKLFIHYLTDRFKKPNPTEARIINKLKYTKQTKNGSSQKYIFDPIPYGKDQNIRFINQSKKGKPYILINETPQYTIRDSFIRLYEGTQNRMQLDITKLDHARNRRIFPDSEAMTTTTPKRNQIVFPSEINT